MRLRILAFLLLVVGVMACGETASNPVSPTSTPPPAPLPAPPQAPLEISMEAEVGSGDGSVKFRSAASRERTALVKAGESRHMDFELAAPARYALSIRYSNDNFGASESVEVRIDDQVVGKFNAIDTGDFGLGWNIFLWAEGMEGPELAAGKHRMSINVTGGDGFGVELDVVRLNR